MGKGYWPVQFEKEHGKLEDQVEEELHKDVPKILGLADAPEDFAV